MMRILCLLILFTANVAAACPFCESTKATLREEIEASDLAVLLEPVDGLEPQATQDPPQVRTLQRPKFRIVEILHGKDRYQGEREIKIVFQGQPMKDQLFLLTGNHRDKFREAEFSSGPGSLPIPKELSEEEQQELSEAKLKEEDILWGVPISISQRGAKYLRKVLELDAPIERARFVIDYLEDPDPTLSEDAYNEIAITSYEDLKRLEDDLPREKFLNWIQDKKVSSSHRRQYLTLLGICGTEADLPLLKELILSVRENGIARNSLDATMACYLLLAGEDGLDLAIDEFLANPEAEYMNVYSVITALRFHGTAANVIPKQKLAEALARMLDEPLYADLIIDDLVRWEYWEVDEKLKELFAQTEDRWLRMPIFKYFYMNPKPQADKTLEELKELDPKGYAQFRLFLTSRSETAEKAEEPTDTQAASPESPKLAAAEEDAPAAQSEPSGWWAMLQENVFSSLNFQLAIMVLGVIALLIIRWTWMRHRAVSS